MLGHPVGVPRLEAPERGANGRVQFAYVDPLRDLRPGRSWRLVEVRTAGRCPAPGGPVTGRPPFPPVTAAGSPVAGGPLVAVLPRRPFPPVTTGPLPGRPHRPSAGAHIPSVRPRPAAIGSGELLTPSPGSVRAAGSTPGGSAARPVAAPPIPLVGAAGPARVRARGAVAGVRRPVTGRGGPGTALVATPGRPLRLPVPPGATLADRPVRTIGPCPVAGPARGSAFLPRIPLGTRFAGRAAVARPPARGPRGPRSIARGVPPGSSRGTTVPPTHVAGSPTSTPAKARAGVPLPRIPSVAVTAVAATAVAVPAGRAPAPVVRATRRTPGPAGHAARASRTAVLTASCRRTGPGPARRPSSPTQPCARSSGPGTGTAVACRPVPVRRVAGAASWSCHRLLDTSSLGGVLMETPVGTGRTHANGGQSTRL
jgi:hypothetical protein